MSFANQYSYILLSLGGVVALIAVLRMARLRWGFTLIVGVVCAALAIVGFSTLRPGSADAADSIITAADAVRIGDGSPTLIEFYSNYCLGCMLARPEVNAFFADVRSTHADAVRLYTVDIHSPGGDALIAQIGFTFSPEYVLFDSDGSEVWRGNSLPSLAQISAVVGG